MDETKMRLRANHVAVTIGARLRPRFAVRLQRAIVFLVLTAWAIDFAACPVPGMASAAAPSQAMHQRHPGHDPARRASDTCCQVLGHGPVFVEAVKAVSAAQSFAATFFVIIAAPLLLAMVDPIGGTVTPLSTGPPRSRYLRFATFWAHAPPY
jgi:hypothetical protein